MPGRKYNTNAYRFGMNGQEKDDEINGIEGAYTSAEYWEYDTRLGRRWNVDPITYPWQSSYVCFNNNPVCFSDPSGLESEDRAGGDGTRSRADDTEVIPETREYARREPSEKTTSATEGLSTTKLRELARKNGITGEGVNFNRKVGKAFEQIALIEFSAIGRQKGHSTPDRFAKYGVGATTIPDASTNVNEFFVDKRGIGKHTYPNASLYEVKAYKGTLQLSTSKGQIKAIIDIAARANNGNTGVACVTYITTSDTDISEAVLAYATGKNVNIFQVVAGLNADGNIVFSGPMQQNVTSHPSVAPISLTQLRVEYSPAVFLNTLQIVPETPNEPDPEEVQ